MHKLNFGSEVLGALSLTVAQRLPKSLRARHITPQLEEYRIVTVCPGNLMSKIQFGRKSEDSSRA